MDGQYTIDEQYTLADLIKIAKRYNIDENAPLYVQAGGLIYNIPSIFMSKEQSSFPPETYGSFILNIVLNADNQNHREEIYETPTRK